MGPFSIASMELRPLAVLLSFSLPFFMSTWYQARKTTVKKRLPTPNTIPIGSIAELVL